MDGIRIVRVGAEDAREYNQFLVRGVREHRDTLRMSEGDIVAAPFATGDESSATFVALDQDGRWSGTVAVERERGREKRAHIAWILRMYVAVEFSRRGVGQQLLLAAIEYGTTLRGVEKLNLTVAAHNDTAVRLYEKHGFREFSREADAFRDPTPRTELSMSMVLAPAPAVAS
jgi:ribosomal protein S18 acetylase RimI-like enzyme